MISIPFKIFFYRKRKGLSISERISKIVKKTLISTPLIFSFIFFIFSFLSVFYSFKQIDVDLLTTPTIKS
ncbi:MAG TPA: hypothetical protein PLF21_00325, partial [Exilispira sp.]|nr:hypothetical protein [Exilispira sp.]